jgi:hypothetical protein
VTPLTRTLVTLAVTAVSATATTNFSFTGSFNFDTDVQYFTFTLLNPTPGVALRTWSYSGGTNAAGDVIPSGGFEPVLSLWSTDGSEMNPGPSGPCTGDTGNPLTTLAPDPVTGACADVYYPTTLSFPAGTWDPGTYTVGLSLYSDPAVGNLSDGYLIPLQGIPVPSNYSCQEGPEGVQGTPPTLRSLGLGHSYRGQCCRCAGTRDRVALPGGRRGSARACPKALPSRALSSNQGTIPFRTA